MNRAILFTLNYQSPGESISLAMNFMHHYRAATPYLGAIMPGPGLASFKMTAEAIDWF